MPIVAPCVRAAILVPALLALAACASGRPATAPPAGTPMAEAASSAASAVAPPTLDASAFADTELAGYCSLLSDSDNPYWGRRQRIQLQDELEKLSAAGDGADQKRLTFVHARLGQEMLRLGEIEDAAGHLATARDLALHKVAMDREWAIGVWWLSALTQFRLAERRNCAFPTGARTGCAMPSGGTGGYADPEDVRSAIRLLEEYLELDPDRRFTMAAVWLLNMAHALAGSYPEGVIEGLRLDWQRYGTGHALKPMPDIAPDLGVDAFDLAGSAVMEDFDNDGYLDLVSSTMDQCDRLKLFRNNGDGTFSDRSLDAGIAGQPGALNLVQTDYDNDGWIDLFLTRGGWLGVDGRQRRSLLRNNGDNTFTDVSRASGLAEPAYPTQTAAWGDYDRDGDLDVFIGNEEASVDEPYPSQLFRNNGDGTFTDVASQAGVTNDRMAKGVAWGDIDNDGDEDLYVSNIGPNRLYVNQGDGTFVDQATELGVTEPATGLGFAAWFWDYDNDGWLDIFAALSSSDLDVMTADYLGQGTAATWSRVYRNRGGAGFEDVTAQVGLDRTLMPMGANYGDVDGDGFPDFYLGTGQPGFEAILPNLMFRNVAGERFEDETAATGTGLLQKGHGVAFGDIDNDGDLDIYHQAGGMYPGDRSHNALFRNPGYGNRWLSIELRGTRSNRAGFGTRIKVTVTEAGRQRDIHAVAGHHGSFGGSSLRQFIGLGGAERIDALEVWWPASDTRQTFDAVEMDRFMRVTEGDDGLETLDRPRVSLGR